MYLFLYYFPFALFPYLFPQMYLLLYFFLLFFRHFCFIIQTRGLSFKANHSTAEQSWEYVHKCGNRYRNTIENISIYVIFQ